MGHDAVDAVGFLLLAGRPFSAGLFERTGDESVFGIRNDRLGRIAVLPFEFAPEQRGGRKKVVEIVGSFDQLVDVGVAAQQLDGQIARRVPGDDVLVGPQFLLQGADAGLDVGAVVDVDVTDMRLVVFEHVDDGFEQLADAFPAVGHGRDDRDADHAGQTAVIELRARFLQLVEHVQRDDHLEVHVDELRGEKQVAFEVRGIDHVDDHVGHFAEQVAAHVELFGRVFGDGIGARQVDQLERVAVLTERGPFGSDRHAAVVAHSFVRAGGGVEERRLSAVGVAHQRHVDRFARFVQKPVDRFAPECRFGGQIDIPADGFRGDGHFDQFGFAVAQGDAVAHDFVFDRVEQRCVLDDRDDLSADESHFGDAVAERPVSEDFGDDAPFGGLEFRQPLDVCFLIFFHKNRLRRGGRWCENRQPDSSAQYRNVG